jgi:hypothetical protein
MAEHIAKICNVTECKTEASYWIDTGDGFVESLLATVSVPSTFYLCADHMSELANEETGCYHHLRIDTGEMFQLEIGSYACSEECDICNM